MQSFLAFAAIRCPSLARVKDVFAPVREWLDRTRGVSGIQVFDEHGVALFGQRADEEFPAASVIKLPLVMTLYADAAEGRLALDERVAVGPRVDGSGLLRLLTEVGPLTLADLAMLSMAVSDNTATNLLIDRVTVERVAERLAEWGCAGGMRLARRMYDFEARARGLENVMKPADTARLLLRLLEGRLVDRATSDAVLRTLDENQDDTLLKRYLPESARLAHKSGWIEGVRNDAGIVWGPRPVVVAGFVRETEPAEASILLGLLGWCAYRAGGAEVPPLPLELSRPS